MLPRCDAHDGGHSSKEKQFHRLSGLCRQPEADAGPTWYKTCIDKSAALYRSNKTFPKGKVKPAESPQPLLQPAFFCRKLNPVSYNRLLHGPLGPLAKGYLEINWLYNLNINLIRVIQVQSLISLDIRDIGFSPPWTEKSSPPRQGSFPSTR